MAMELIPTQRFQVDACLTVKASFQMIAKAAQSISRSIFFLTLFVCSCDFFSDDSINPEDEIKFTQNEFYTLPNSSIVIDIGGIVEQSFISATITISKQPLRGKLSEINSFLLKYRPASQFQGGEDHFEISVSRDGKVLTTKIMTIHMKPSKAEFPCALIAVQDKIAAKPGSPISTRILDNDWLCNVDKSALDISILSEAVFGTAAVEGESITYVPGSSYQGRDELIYKLTPTGSARASYGILSVTGWTAESMELPNRFLSELVFVNDTTGYLGGAGIYKTIDGGKHWNQVLSASDIDGDSVAAIHFLDENNGFAAYTSCKDSWVNCINGLATTNNGGASWTLTPINYSSTISSIFFTSATTGFISGDDWGTDKTVILKTTDAGKTWKQLIFGGVDGLHYSALELKYANASIGYGFQYGDVFIARDEGEVWERYTFYDDLPSVRGYVFCMDVIDENTFFAGLINCCPDRTSIVRYVRNSAPKEVAVVPYYVWQLEFSPTRNVGFALAVKRADPPSDQSRSGLALYKSTDKGETWSDEYIDEYIDDAPDFHFDPVAMSVPSDRVVYLLYSGNLIKYYN